MWKRIAKLVGDRAESEREAELTRDIARLTQRVDDMVEELRMARHDLAVEQSRAAALEIQTRFLHSALDAELAWVQATIAKHGYDLGRLTQST